MRLRIVRPLPPELDGFTIDDLKFGAAYDIRPPLCDLLLLDGYGILENEQTVDPPPAKKPSAGDGGPMPDRDIAKLVKRTKKSRRALHPRRNTH